MSRLVEEIDATDINAGTFKVWWIGQEGYVFKTPRQIIYIDPYLSTYAERVTQGQANEHVRIHSAPMQPEKVVHADIVLCTHDHADHIDPDGIPLIAKASPQAQFVVPECARDTMLGFGIVAERIHTLRGDDSLTVNGLTVHAIPGAHEQLNEDPEKGFPFLSYVFELEGHTVLHAGDTIPYPGQAEKVHAHQADLAFLPINGRDEFRHALDFEGNFTCEEAVGFGLSIKAGLTIPMHYDMFTLNTADVADFERIAKHRGLKHYIMQHEEGITYPLG
jgi:L-ascorbate 6-phosphate lactonase